MFNRSWQTISVYNSLVSSRRLKFWPYVTKLLNNVINAYVVSNGRHLLAQFNWKVTIFWLGSFGKVMESWVHLIIPTQFWWLVAISEHRVLSKKFQCYAKEYLKSNYVVCIVPVSSDKMNLYDA
jgi:hypothetical protein